MSKIPMKNLRSGDVFEKDGRVEAAIDITASGYVWVTRPEYYRSDAVYGYTSAALVPIEDTEVELIKNLNEPSLTLRDILPEYPLRNIEVRTYDPDGEDMLFGFCHWTGTELVSGDGDSYYLDDPIAKYEFDEQTRSLTYWFKGVWL